MARANEGDESVRGGFSVTQRGQGGDSARRKPEGRGWAGSSVLRGENQGRIGGGLALGGDEGWLSGFWTEQGAHGDTI